MQAKINHNKRVLFGIPMTGLIRSEWHMSYVSMVTPCNWSNSRMVKSLRQSSPIGFLVAEARNIIAQEAIRQNYEWLFFIDHDVCLPPHTLIKFNEYLLKGDIPVFGGLYFTKGVPSEPLIYRGLGNSYYNKFKIGDKVWATGMGLGCTFINVKLLKTVYEDSEEYQVEPGLRVRRIFETPCQAFVDPETGFVSTSVGTEDLHFYNRLKEKEYLAKAGWPKIQKRKNFILCDTSIMCKHIDFNGIAYPSMGEELAFIRK